MVAALTDHVFADEAMIGTSLAIVVTGGAVIALVCFRMALRYLSPAIVAREAA
jgi:hypothetical protein